MARSKAAETAIEQAETQVQIIEDADRALAPYLDGKPYDHERLVSEVELFYQQHTGTAYEIGKRLIALKANCEHGQFTALVLKRVGITGPYASSLMAFARTVIESAALTDGRLDVKRLSAMDHRKVLLLGEVIAEDPDEVAERGTIGGRTLDEWDAMTRDELKKTIRQQQAKIEQGQEQLRETKDKLLAERDRVDTLLSATPNAVTESVTRFGQRIRDALASFESTALCDAELEPDSATILDLVGLKSELRTFYDRAMHMIDERFPAVLAAEVPTDIDLTAAPTILKEPSPIRKDKSKSANIVDAN